MDDIFVRGLQTAFQEEYDTTAVLYEDLTLQTTSDGPDERYAWLGSLPRMREMRGERIPKRLLDYGYTLVNKEWEASLEIPQKDLDDDQTGKFGPLARNIGESARLFPEELIFGTLLPGGFTNLGYDGQFFFDTDHSSGASGVQSNLITTKLGPTGFNAARALLRKLKDDNARPINPRLDLVLMVPPELESAAEDLIGKQYLAGGGNNPLYQAAEVRVNPWLTNANAWYLFNRIGQVKPFVLQTRTFEPLAVLGGTPDNDSETHFMRRTNYMGTYWRGNAGYGLWEKAVASDGSTGTVGV